MRSEKDPSGTPEAKRIIQLEKSIDFLLLQLIPEDKTLRESVSQIMKNNRTPTKEEIQHARSLLFAASIVLGINKQ